MKKRNKPKQLTDRKKPHTYGFWSLVNKIAIHFRFQDFQIIGKEYLPKSGPFILVSNHISRWDGLVVYKSIGRPANFMVSPNELLGLQGIVLTSMGAFPADPRADIIEFAQKQFEKGEGLVIFPEGDIFTDGSTHHFKNGAARIALTCAEAGLIVPIVPCAIHYASGSSIARLSIGPAVDPQPYQPLYAENGPSGLKNLSQRLHREVCHLRYGLGEFGDKLILFSGGEIRNNVYNSQPPVFR